MRNILVHIQEILYVVDLSIAAFVVAWRQLSYALLVEYNRLFFLPVLYAGVQLFWVQFRPS